MTRSAPGSGSPRSTSIAVPPPEVTARSWPAAVNGAAPMNWKAWLPLTSGLASSVLRSILSPWARLKSVMTSRPWPAVEQAV